MSAGSGQDTPTVAAPPDVGDLSCAAADPVDRGLGASFLDGAALEADVIDSPSAGQPQRDFR